jgi:hypothetical protein
MDSDLYWFVNDPFGKVRKQMAQDQLISITGGEIYTSISGEPCIPVPLWAGGGYLPEILQDISSQPPIISGEPGVSVPIYCPGELNVYAEDYVWEDL